MKKKPVKIIPDWIFSNLNEYGNCLIPSAIVKTYGLKNVEKAIKKEGQIKVKIKEQRVKKNGELMPLDTTFQKNVFITDYIAERKDK